MPDDIMMAQQRRQSVPMSIHFDHIKEDDSSQCSTLSGITLVTNDPKLDLPDEKTLNKMRMMEQTVIQLTDDERNALLNVINQEQENKMRRQARQENIRRRSWTERTKFFELLKSSRLQKPLEDFEEILSKPDEDEEQMGEFDTWENDSDEAKSYGVEPNEPDLPKATGQKSKDLHPQENQGIKANLCNFYSPKTSLRVREEKPSRNETLSHDTGSTETNHIDEIIRLKLLIANQQATIDTLSSKVHNMEVSNRQVQCKMEMESTRMTQDFASYLWSRQAHIEALSEENQDLVNEISGLKLEIARLQSPVSRAQNRTLASKRPKTYVQQLEEENSILKRENSELKREIARLQSPVCRGQKRRESNSTLSTVALSEDDCAWTY